MIAKSLMVTEDIERYLKESSTAVKSEAAIIREAVWASQEYKEWEMNQSVEDENN